MRLLADRVGLTDALSGALRRSGFVPGHDRGRVLADVATMLVAGGEAIADIDTLRHQEEVLGPVASPPTVWRALDELLGCPMISGHEFWVFQAASWGLLWRSRISCGVLYPNPE